MTYKSNNWFMCIQVIIIVFVSKFLTTKTIHNIYKKPSHYFIFHSIAATVQYYP